MNASRIGLLLYLAIILVLFGPVAVGAQPFGYAAAASAPTPVHTDNSTLAPPYVGSWGWNLSDFMPETGIICPAYLLSDGQPVFLLDRGNSLEKQKLKDRSQRYLWYPFTNVLTAISRRGYQEFIDTHNASIISEWPILGFNSVVKGVVIEHGDYNSISERCYLNFQNYYSVFHGIDPVPVRSFFVLEFVKPYKVVASERCNNEHNTIYDESVVATAIEIAPLPDGTLLIWSFPGSNFVLRLDSSMHQKTTLGGRVLLVNKTEINKVFQSLGNNTYDLLPRYRAIVAYLSNHSSKE